MACELCSHMLTPLNDQRESKSKERERDIELCRIVDRLITAALERLR